ncbi:hypothetical protein PGTUg99_021788 [Puccinia graminis f. sp. tritici]|uniref:Uncharacterized protein n=1 Tax=Puccinia graminis f. sp. tritici TaxID=56615 RepID=A0A5B0M8J1_PUCGR|nr:hypothetical protein PGTUg99_021788 [Puccinia graminis f. sp. tritici]
MLETLDLFGHDRSNEPPPIVKNSCKIEYEKTIEPASKRPKGHTVLNPPKHIILDQVIQLTLFL